MSSQLEELEPKLTEQYEAHGEETTVKKRPQERQQNRPRPQSEKRNRSSRPPPGDEQEASLEDYVEALLRQQKLRQSRSQYGKASRCKRQLHALRQGIQHRNMKVIRKRFREEEKEILRARQKELDEMDAVWSQIVQTYQQKCNTMLEEWRRRKQEDQYRLEHQLAELRSQSNRPFSKDFMTLQKTEQRLADQENYSQARKVHKSLQKLKRELVGKGRDNLMMKEMSLRKQMQDRHRKQSAALMKRILSGRQQQQLMYDKQHEKLHLKFENILKQHRRQQGSEMEKIERYNRTQSKPWRNADMVNLSRLDASWIVNNSNV